jgi:hypothetical protein
VVYRILRPGKTREFLTVLLLCYYLYSISCIYVFSPGLKIFLNFAAKSAPPNRHAFHDVGQAMARLSLQANELGLTVCQMAGFEVEKLVKLFLFQPLRTRHGRRDRSDQVAAQPCHRCTHQSLTPRPNEGETSDSLKPSLKSVF